MWNGLVILLVSVWCSAASAQSHELEAVMQALRSKQYEQALHLLRPLVESGSGDPRVWTLQGMALAAAGQRKQSLASYRKALEQQPDYLPALQGAAEIEYRDRDSQARARLEKILAIQPDNATAHAMMAVVAFEQEDCAAAVDHFARGGAATRRNPVALGQQGRCLFLVGRSGDAAEVFRQLVAAQPENDTVRHNLGLSLYESGRYAEAIEVLRPLADRAKPDSDVLSLMADVHEANQETPNALSTLQKAVELYPREERHYTTLAELCSEHGAYDLGLEILSVGIKNIPGSSRILSMQGVIHAQLGRYEEAEAAFQRAAQLSPNQELSALGLTVAMQQTGRLAESIELLRKRAAKNPNEAAMQLMLGQALIKNGAEPGQEEFEEARAALRRSVELKPDATVARVELGKLYLKAGDLDGAIGHLQQALTLDPSERTATYQLMVALRKAGRPQEAAALARKVRAQLQREKAEEVERNRYQLVKVGAK